jgi:anti-anti-sigma regulatory factor
VDAIILDVSAVSGLDPSSAKQLQDIQEEYKEIGVDFMISGCSGNTF